MEEARCSDIADTQINLVDLSELNQSEKTFSGNLDDDSMHQAKQQGFCVKEFEEEMQSLKKENFNLKLRIYFLEEKNPNIPDGAETLYKQNIDLKIENESLMKDLQEKQDLLCEASKALEMLDGQKSQDLNRSQMTIDELNQKIESLQHENAHLQNAIIDANKSILGNDTGYADFLGAVDSKDIDYQRKMVELTQLESNFMRQINEMNEKVTDLQNQKKDIEIKASNLLYENDEMKDKLASVEMAMNEQLKRFNVLKIFCREKLSDYNASCNEIQFCLKKNQKVNQMLEESKLSKAFYQSEQDLLTYKLELELKEFKEKWAATQCDLQDTEEKLKATETERDKTLSFLKKSLVALEQERVKINDLENTLSESRATAVNKDYGKNGAEKFTDIQKEVSMKNQEINELKHELFEAKRQIQIATSQDISEKNREIEKLSNLLRNIDNGRNSLTPANRFSLEQLSESFNELKFQQAMEEKKQSQQKIDRLMDELANVATAKTKEHITQLQYQMSIVVQKQEVTDSALGKCAELCAYSLDHLHELAQFLNALLQQKEIKESLSEMTMLNIQSTLDKTLEFSNQAERFSMQNRMSLLPDLSSLEILMTSARNSLANLKEVQGMNKSVQANDGEEEMKLEMETLQNEFYELNKVNQLLEDEICRLKESLENYKVQLEQSREEVSTLKEDKNELNEHIQQKDHEAEQLYNQCEETEKKLTGETIKKIEFEMRAFKSESLASELQEKLDTIRTDLESNWITKNQHETVVKRLEDDISNGEAQVAAIRLEIESLRSGMSEIKTDDSSNLGELNNETNNLNAPSSRRTLQISEDRKCLLTSVSESAVTSTSCIMCPKYQAKIEELKKYLAKAMDQIKFQAEVKARNDRHIQKRINDTESFLHSARSNMENILKPRNQE